MRWKFSIQLVKILVSLLFLFPYIKIKFELLIT